MDQLRAAAIDLQQKSARKYEIARTLYASGEIDMYQIRAYQFEAQSTSYISRMAVELYHEMAIFRAGISRLRDYSSL